MRKTAVQHRKETITGEEEARGWVKAERWREEPTKTEHDNRMWEPSALYANLKNNNYTSKKQFCFL